MWSPTAFCVKERKCDPQFGQNDFSCADCGERAEIANLVLRNAILKSHDAIR